MFISSNIEGCINGINEHETIVFALLIITGIVMISGCGVSDKEQKDNEEQELIDKSIKYCETSSSFESFNYTTGEWMVPTTNTQTNNQDSQTQKSSSSSTQKASKSNSQSSTPNTPQACSHPSITTKYVGMSGDRIIYDTYCSKCGESLGRVTY